MTEPGEPKSKAFKWLMKTCIREARTHTPLVHKFTKVCKTLAVTRATKYPNGTLIMSSSATVLLVDDSRASRMLCCSVIRSLRPGLQLLEAGDGQAALALLVDVSPALAVLDMNMPGMSGLDLAEKIRVLHPETKLALLTANVQDAIKQRAAGLGVHFFRKPISEAVISDILELLD
jgi:two-component system, chemotaxis family, chemotaxis protein CheY